MTSHLPVSILNTHLDESIWGEFHLFDFISAKVDEYLSMDMMVSDEGVKVGLCFCNRLVHLAVNIELQFLWGCKSLFLSLLLLGQFIQGFRQDPTNHSSINKGVFSDETCSSIFENNQLESLVKPTIIPIAKQ